MPCGPLNGAWKTGSHLRVRGDCHVSAHSGLGRDNFIGIRVLVLNDFKLFWSPVDIGNLNSLKIGHLNSIFEY